MEYRKSTLKQLSPKEIEAIQLACHKHRSETIFIMCSYPFIWLFNTIKRLVELFFGCTLSEN